MSWQIAVILHTVIGSFIAITMSAFSLRSKQTFFFTGVILYLIICTVGITISTTVQGGLPPIPKDTMTWVFLIGEGVFIPIGWLIQYRLVRSIGASNSVIVGTLNACMASLLGIILLGEGISLSFLLGAMLIVSSSIIALKIKSANGDKLPIKKGLGLLMLGMLTFAIGIYCEKQAISLIGVLDYAVYGWLLQLISMVTIFAIMGRKEIRHISKQTLVRSVILGALTSISSVLFVYALSQGTISQTSIATSSKLALTMVLSALLLKEANYIWIRIVALALASTGVWIITA